MRILVTDDEGPARVRLRRLLDGIPGIEVVGEAANGREALVLSDRLKPDIVLMDIRMPVIDGLEAATHLSGYEHPPAVIFTTAYGDHALAAFEANAVDYLVKPIRAARLAEALEKAGRPNRAQLAALRGPAGRGTARTHICVPRRGGMVLIPVSEIAYFRADHKYVTVRHTGGEVLIEEPLKGLEAEFRGQFLRIHRNTLISLSFMSGIERGRGGGYRVVLRGVAERPEVSRRHVAALKAHLAHYRVAD